MERIRHVYLKTMKNLTLVLFLTLYSQEDLYLSYQMEAFVWLTLIKSILSISVLQTAVVVFHVYDSQSGLRKRN